MTLMITADEIISMTGIRKGTDTAILGRHLIDSVQEEYIRPTLAQDLYDLMLTEVAACTFTGVNETLWKEYIKPVLAHYVWLKVLPQLHMQSTNAGLQVNNSEFANGATNDQRADLATSVQSIALSLEEKMCRYMTENEDQFDDWSSGTSVSNDVNIKGGIIIQRS